MGMSTICWKTPPPNITNTSSIKQKNKNKLEHFDDIRFREAFRRIGVLFILQNKICPLLRQDICVYVNKLVQVCVLLSSVTCMCLFIYLFVHSFIYIYIYIYVWKLNQTVLELDFRAVNFLFFPRRDLNPHHWYTAAPFA